jgi:hypothetical protein
MNWITNALLGAILLTSGGYWYYLHNIIVDNEPLYYEKYKFKIDKENFNLWLKPDPQKKVVEVKKPTVKKEPKKILKDSNIIYFGNAVNKEQRVIALIRVSGKNQILKITDKFKESLVKRITLEYIEIDGFKKIWMVGIKKKKGVGIKNGKKIKRMSGINFSTKRDSTGKENKGVSNHTADIINIEPEIIIIEKNKEQHDKVERVVLRSVVRQIQKEPSQIYKYVRLTRSGEGVLISPKSGYEHVYAGIGFRYGDIILKVNGRSVMSPNILIEVINAANSRSIRLLVKNGKNQRTVVVNLMRAYKF